MHLLDYPSLYERTGETKDINTMIVPLSVLQQTCRLIAETYQVVGILADDAGRFNSLRVLSRSSVYDEGYLQCVLDNLSEGKVVHQDVLPFKSIFNKE